MKAVDSLNSIVCDAGLEAEGKEPFCYLDGGLTICCICAASLVDLCFIYLCYVPFVFVISH
jgi:hypothetical protein